jgi:hypothetical protein
MGAVVIGTSLFLYALVISLSRDWDPPLPRPAKETHELREWVLSEMDRLF